LIGEGACILSTLVVLVDDKSEEVEDEDEVEEKAKEMFETSESGRANIFDSKDRNGVLG